MADKKPAIVVTGIAGNLGLRLLPLLSDYEVIGLDMRPPSPELPLYFEPVDLGHEAACERLVDILRHSRATAIVHLAFVIDPVRTGILDRDRMWQINVAGTARVLEAIAEFNRNGGAVSKLVYPSSVSVYGSELPPLVTEDHPHQAHTLPYAIHKKEVEAVIAARVRSLGPCSTYVLRPHIFSGATVQNYLVGALRGTPTGRGKFAERMRARGSRLPILLPIGRQYLETKFQFVHIDDMARLIAHVLRRSPTVPEAHVVNVAGRGPVISMQRAIELAQAKVLRLPGKAAVRRVLQLMWDWGISGVPPESLPYFTGSYTMDTRRLREFLGSDYEQVIRYTNEAALADSFAATATVPQTMQQSA
jgi:nucleoside-diphosphate-sugar epimerase